ncbi:MAG: TPM domain-containing protein [Flavobacteriales bacterium]
MKRLLLIPVLLLAGVLSAARFDCSIEPPKERDQTKLVWQYTEFLSTSEEARLNAKLVEFARETSNRILVIVVDTLCGLPESDLAFDIGEKWGIGNAKFDNGIVFLIKPNGPPGQRKVFVATGYGLEGAIPDLAAKNVVEDYVIPNFKQARYFDGVDAATDVLMAMAKGEFNEQSHGKAHGKKSFPWPILIIVFIFFGAIFFSWRNRVRNYSRTNNIDFWTAMWLLSQMDRRHGRGGGWGGGGGFGGGGGGGFGGFGGGSFGGGGAGGSW